MMKVFICWSGDTSGQIATHLRDWLPKVHQRIKAFISKEDIGKGIRWTHQLTKELEDSDFGLVCLAPENLSAPWLHFEAGALSKVAQSRVVPVLFQLKTSDVQGPLSDFQFAILRDKQEIFRVLKSINDAMGTEANNVWERTFESLWGELARNIDALIIQDKIQISSPVSGGVLEKPEPQWEGFTYEIRGTLKILPKGHEICLLNASNETDGAKQWPQRIVKYNSLSGEWEGRIYSPRSNTDTVINAVVAPPTAQLLFEYYRQYGSAENPLPRIPPDCTNKAQVRARAPRPLPTL